MMIDKLRLQKITLPSEHRDKWYYQFLFRRLFRAALCSPNVMRKMRHVPLHGKFECNIFHDVFLTSVKQIHDPHIERYQLHLFDKKKDVIFSGILILKTDGTLWIDVNVIKNRYFHSGIFYRTEGTSSKAILSGLTKTLLTWS